MKSSTKPLSAEEKFLADNPDIETVELIISDINGIMRGKWAPRDTLKKVSNPGVNLPMSIFGLDIWGREVDGTGLQIDSGDLDGFCKAVEGRISRVTWSERSTAQVLMTMHDDNNKPFEADPRNALKKTLRGLSKKGLKPVVAFELEFYLVESETYYRNGKITDLDTSGEPDLQDMYSLSQLSDYSDFLDDIKIGAKAQNLPIDTIIKEAAPGQFEINLQHRDDVMIAADDTVLLRRLICECARKHGLKASFMAKPFLDWPGNGMHVHASLLDKAGMNIFSGKAGKKKLKHAAAGLLDTISDCLLFFIPGYNGFRRLQAGSYAPTNIAWGINNRSVTVRVPASDDAATRLEHRLSGADANPYLVLSAILGGMLEGLEKGKNPPAPIEGNAYTKSLPRVCDNMKEAIKDFENSKFVEKLVGKKLKKIYAEIKKVELAEFDNQITPLERKTYL